MPSSPSAAANGISMPAAGEVHIAPSGEMLAGPILQQASVDTQALQVASSMQGSSTHMPHWNAPMETQFWIPQITLEGCHQLAPLLPDSNNNMTQLSPVLSEDC